MSRHQTKNIHQEHKWLEGNEQVCLLHSVILNMLHKRD